MNKNTLSYLANIALVRSHLNIVLGVSRGVVSQKVMHQISAQSTVLDKLFVDTLLSGQCPESASQTVVQQNNDDFIDITKRLEEEKAKIVAKKAGLISSDTTNNDDLLASPIDEVSAFESLLAQTDAPTQTKDPPSPKKSFKKGVVSRKTTSKK